MQAKKIATNSYVILFVCQTILIKAKQFNIKTEIENMMIKIEYVHVKLVPLVQSSVKAI